MRLTRSKICGITDPESALVAAESGADAIGLVFVEKSPRCITVEQAHKIVDVLPAFVQPVGLFVNAPVDHVRQTAIELGLRTVQLHGDESPDDVSALAPLRVIKALAFKSRDISSTLEKWRPPPHNLAGILFDAPPKGHELPGGSGTTFDWDALATLTHSGLLAGLPPTILAGGLTPANVGDAIELVAPYAVDVSSGVESSRGVKDHDLIHTFGRAVQAADAKRFQHQTPAG